MASAPTHVVATGAIAAFFHRPRVPWHLWLAGAVLALAPDLDVFAPRVGVPYRDLLAPRALSHSLLAAAVFSGLLVMVFYRDGAGPLRAKRVWLFLFLAMASHGVLDALTKGGLGVAFFAPFSAKRYFFPIRPLEVSPLNIRPFLTSRGLAILLNEMRWVWAPSIGVAVAVLMLRSWLRPPPRRVTTRPRPAAKPLATPAPPVILSSPEPSPEPPPPPAPPASAPLLQAIADRFRLRFPFRLRRGHLVLLIVGVVVVAAVFVALQPLPPPPATTEQAPAPVAPPPMPLQADAEGYYEPGYRFTVSDARFMRLTLRPEPSVTFARGGGTRQEAGCFNGLIRADRVQLRCDIERVGIMTIEGRFLTRFATTSLATPVLSADLTVRNARGEMLYRARDSFVWRPPD
jgi:inner membrane protein